MRLRRISIFVALANKRLKVPRKSVQILKLPETAGVELFEHGVGSLDSLPETSPLMLWLG